MATYPALTIASQFINRGIAEGKPITPMKLQKLIYFAHGLNLARNGEPLIREPIEAWNYGPVIPGVYYRFKRWGNNPITTPITFDIDEQGELVSPGSTLDPAAQDSINLTWDITKDYNAIQLSNWTHIDGSPWYKSVSRTESGLADREVIDNELIRDYFTNVLEHGVGE